MAQLWDEIVVKSGHPSWHVRNLNALNDGWVTGGLDEFGPPYEFISQNVDKIRTDFLDLANAVMRIACESIKENGGQVRCKE